MLSRSVVSDSLRPMDCSPPGSSAYGILQARILEWVAIPSPGDLSKLGIEPRSPASEPPGKPPIYITVSQMYTDVVTLNKIKIYLKDVLIYNSFVIYFVNQELVKL